jgi:hypothetical protein
MALDAQEGGFASAPGYASGWFQNDGQVKELQHDERASAAG